MGEEKQPILDSNVLFPTMMQATRLLVLDYDVTRYHSFDLFRYLLTDREWFMNVDPMFIPLIKEPDVLKQILFYSRHCSNTNPFDNFPKYQKKITVESFETTMNENFAKMKTTPTELNVRFGVVFNRRDITGYLLRYGKDPHIAGFADDVSKVYTSDHVLDTVMAMEIIKRHNINAVMVSSIDIAIAIALQVVQQNLPTPMTFLIANYFYNYEPVGNMVMRNIPVMNRLEYLYKFEFVVFDPYTGLNQQRKEGIISEPTI